MTVYPIIKKECDVTGEYGYILESKQYYEGYIVDLNGDLIAHDILEHPFKVHNNLIVDEFMALGAVAYFRYNYRPHHYGFYYRGETFNIASDIQSLLSCIYYDDNFIPEAPLKYSKNQIIKSSLQKALKDVKDGLLSDVEDLDEETEWFNSRFDKETVKRIEGWLAEGERRFKKRFERLDYYYNISHIFDEIVRCVKLAYNLDYFNFSLKVNYTNSTVQLIENKHEV